MADIKRIIIVGGSKRGKSTLGRKLSEQHRLTHLQTDPQRLLSLGDNGTPDDLSYSGKGGVGEWVCRNWLNRERSCIEGVKAIDALARYLRPSPTALSSDMCDLLIVLTERVSGCPEDDEWAGQEKQAAHTLTLIEELDRQLDNLELWYPIGGDFKRADY